MKKPKMTFTEVKDGFWDVLTVPTKALMSICTVSILIFCYGAVFKGLKIPTEVLAFYGMVLGSYATSKTITTISANNKTDSNKVETSTTSTSDSK